MGFVQMSGICITLHLALALAEMSLNVLGMGVVNFLQRAIPVTRVCHQVCLRPVGSFNLCWHPGRICFLLLSPSAGFVFTLQEPVFDMLSYLN